MSIYNEINKLPSHKFGPGLGLITQNNPFDKEGVSITNSLKGLSRSMATASESGVLSNQDMATYAQLVGDPNRTKESLLQEINKLRSFYS
jgi:hypothetical protein